LRGGGKDGAALAGKPDPALGRAMRPGSGPAFRGADGTAAPNEEDAEDTLCAEPAGEEVALEGAAAAATPEVETVAEAPGAETETVARDPLEDRVDAEAVMPAPETATALPPDVDVPAETGAVAGAPIEGADAEMPAPGAPTERPMPAAEALPGAASTATSAASAEAAA
jgi:hypothetical protein